MKRIFVQTIGFLVASGMIAYALPAVAADSAVGYPVAPALVSPSVLESVSQVNHSPAAVVPNKAAALTAEETAILRQSIAILGTIVQNLNNRVAAEDGSMANAQEIKATLVAIASNLNQINGTLAAMTPRTPAIAKKSPPPAAEQPAAAPNQQAAPMPAVAQNDTGALTPAANGNAAYSETPAAPANGSNDQVAQTGSVFTTRKILGIVIILAAVIGTVLFLRREDKDELSPVKSVEPTQI